MGLKYRLEIWTNTCFLIKRCSKSEAILSKGRTGPFGVTPMSSHSPTTVGRCFDIPNIKSTVTSSNTLIKYLPQANAVVNLVQFSDDYDRISAINRLLYCDNATGDAEVKEFGVPGASPLPAGPVTDSANPTGPQI